MISWEHYTFSSQVNRALLLEEGSSLASLIDEALSAWARRHPHIEERRDLESNPLTGRRLDMKQRFSEVQIIGFLREAEAGLAVKDLCRRHGWHRTVLVA